eukprot:10999924-Lingulodinium_polyedra.AAC.1
MATTWFRSCGQTVRHWLALPRRKRTIRLATPTSFTVAWPRRLASRDAAPAASGLDSLPTQAIW